MLVTQELKIVGLLLSIKVLHLVICITIITIKKYWHILINKFHLIRQLLSVKILQLILKYFFSTYVSFLNFALEKSGYSQSLTVLRTIMVMERLKKVLFEKNSGTTIQSCNLAPIPTTRANIIQHALHTRYSRTVLFKLMKTRKLPLLLLAIHLVSDEVIRVKTWIDHCKFFQERAIARNLCNSSKQ